MPYYLFTKFVTKKYYLDKEEPDKILDTYKIPAYPTMIFIDGEGKEIGRFSGGSSTPIDFQNRVANTIDPQNSPEAWKARIKQDSTQNISYLNYLLQMHMSNKANEVLNKALKELPLSLIFSEEWIKYYRRTVVDISSPVLQLMLSRKDEVSKIMGKEEYKKFMQQKSTYFLARNTTNKFYKRENLDKIIKDVEAIPELNCVLCLPGFRKKQH